MSPPIIQRAGPGGSNQAGSVTALSNASHRNTEPEQRSLFERHTGRHDRAPLAANADPITSHLAAQEITGNGVRDDQKANLAAWMRDNPLPATSAKIAAASGFDRRGVARRLSDLERDGPVDRAGIAIGHRPAISWKPQGLAGTDA